MASSTSFETTIISALDARNKGVKFPLKFNDVWQDSGYSRKNNAVKAFKENCSDLMQGEDYDFDHELSQNTKQRGRPYDDILLTVEAYNFFLARARTPEGTAKLRYLILIEKTYRENLNRQLAAYAQPQVDLKEFEAKIRREEEEKAYWQRLHDLNGVIDKVKALQKSNSYLRNQLEYSEQRREQLHVEYQDKNSDLEAEVRELKREIYKIIETEKRQVFNHFRICFLHTCMEVIYQMIPIWDECRLPELAAKLSIIKTYLDKTYENSCYIVNTLDLNEDTDAAMREREKQKKDLIRFFDAYKTE